MTSSMSKRPASRAISACTTIRRSKSPSSSRKCASSFPPAASATSYASSIRAGNSDSCVCSRSHGQPPGPRSFATISQSFPKLIVELITPGSESADDSFMVDLSNINSQLSTNSNPPQGTVCAELGDFARGLFADVNRDTNHADKRAGKDERNQPGGDMPDAEGMVKRHEIVNRRGGVQEYFR